MKKRLKKTASALVHLLLVVWLALLTSCASVSENPHPQCRPEAGQTNCQKSQGPDEDDDMGRMR